MAILVARCCQKTNQLQSVQGYGMQTFVSPRNKRKVLPWQHLLPGLAEKLIGSSLCRGMESKEPTFLVLPVIVVKLISSNPCRGLVCKRPPKRFISPRNMKKCCHGNTCYQILPRKQLHINFHAMKPSHKFYLRHVNNYL